MKMLCVKEIVRWADINRQQEILTISFEHDKLKRTVLIYSGLTSLRDRKTKIPW